MTNVILIITANSVRSALNVKTTLSNSGSLRLVNIVILSQLSSAINVKDVQIPKGNMVLLLLVNSASKNVHSIAKTMTKRYEYTI